jgi:hypothetical protein
MCLRLNSSHSLLYIEIRDAYYCITVIYCKSFIIAYFCDHEKEAATIMNHTWYLYQVPPVTMFYKRAVPVTIIRGKRPLILVFRHHSFFQFLDSTRGFLELLLHNIRSLKTSFIESEKEQRTAI